VGRQGTGYRWVVLSIAFFSVFGALGFGRFGYSAVLPSMQKALSLNAAAAGSLASWNLAGYTIMAAIGGILAARSGPRKVITAGVLVTAVGMVVTGVATSLATASAGRFITGLGNGVVLVPSVTLMAAWFGRHQLGLASSIVTTGASLALVVVGLAVPRIVTAGGTGGWRFAWYFFAGVTFAMAILSATMLRDHPKADSRTGREIVLPKSAPLALRARVPRPSLELKRIFRSRFAWHVGMVYVLYGLAFLIYFTFFQKRLTTDLGYTGATAGYFFLLVGVAGLVGGALWGSISDRIGRKQTIALALALAGAAGLLFGLSPNTPSLAISAVLFGSTGPVIPGLVGAACSEKFGYLLAPASLGFVTVLVGLGQTIGPYLGGALADASSSFGPTYIFSGALFFAGALGALVLGDMGPEHGRAVQKLPQLPVDRWPIR
jgi:MFS family permease